VAVPTLDTERLVLRPWGNGDLETYARITSDPETMRYMWTSAAHTPPLAEADVRAMVEHWERWDFGHWVVEERETGEMVGRTGIKRHDDWELDPENTEVGWLYDRSRWNRGYATEGALAALRFAFDELERPDVISIAHVGNAASQRVMDKAGLSRRGERSWRGMDVAWWGITREEWETGA
jgi:RimJ/RimL family protein N-acetyltransferase